MEPEPAPAVDMDMDIVKVPLENQSDTDLHVELPADLRCLQKPEENVAIIGMELPGSGGTGGAAGAAGAAGAVVGDPYKVPILSVFKHNREVHTLINRAHLRILRGFNESFGADGQQIMQNSENVTRFGRDA